MTNYWTDTHDKAIQAYYQSATQADRNRIIDKILAPPLYELAKRCLTSFGLHPTDELQQDIVVHLVCKTLPKLTEDKLQGAFQFLWVSARNYTLTYIMVPHDYRTESLDCLIEREYTDTGDMNIYCSEVYIQHTYFTQMGGPRVECVDLDATYEREKVRSKILAEIDIKLKGQHIVNTTNSVFLMLLKQYILDNDYDVRGFGEYIMNTMHLKLSTYRAIAGRLGLRTKNFNEKLLK